MFEVSGQQARLKSGVELFAYTPIVSQAQKSSWENYTVQDHQNWIASSREIYLSSDFAQPGTTYDDRDNATATPYIWQYDATTSDDSQEQHQQQAITSSMQPPYAPTWQVRLLTLATKPSRSFGHLLRSVYAAFSHTCPINFHC
jgi:hypothetical protein